MFVYLTKLRLILRAFPIIKIFLFLFHTLIYNLQFTQAKRMYTLYISAILDIYIPATDTCSILSSVLLV